MAAEPCGTLVNHRSGTKPGGILGVRVDVLQHRAQTFGHRRHPTPPSFGRHRACSGRSRLWAVDVARPHLRHPISADHAHPLPLGGHTTRFTGDTLGPISAQRIWANLGPVRAGPALESAGGGEIWPGFDTHRRFQKDAAQSSPHTSSTQANKPPDVGANPPPPN